MIITPAENSTKAQDCKRLNYLPGFPAVDLSATDPG
jgi:hypothetical protein